MDRFARYFIVVMALSFIGINSSQALISTNSLNPLQPNGCSKSPDGWWEHCCIEHDIDYFIGGSRSDRKDSDRRLRRCMKEVRAPGWVYFIAVRLFGYKSWGGGWLNRRETKELNPVETEIIINRLEEFRRTAQYRKYYREYYFYHRREPTY